MRIVKRLFKWVFIGIAGIVLVLSVLFWFYDWYVMTGNSMEPTLQENDVVLGRTSPNHLKRGEVILFLQGDAVYCKRVVGMPGDKVRGTQEGVYINGERIPYPISREFGPVTVPARHVFVLGDNAAASMDSRHFGPVEMNRVLARVDWIIAPPSRMGRLKSRINF